MSLETHNEIERSPGQVWTILSADKTREPEQRYSDTTHSTDTYWPLDITIIHLLAILRQKHNIIRWEIPNSQLNLNKCPIYVVTMNTIANLPLSINSDLHCLQRMGHNHFHLFYMCMFAPASCYGIIRIGFERLDTKYVD